MFLALALMTATVSAQQAKLTGWAAVPSDFIWPGPTSGQFTKPANGVTPPYEGQILPGVSAILPADTAGEIVGLPDNGFGGIDNSADFILSLYVLAPDFKTTTDDTDKPGPVAVKSVIQLNDRNGLLTDGVGIEMRPVYARQTYYPAPAKQIPVDKSIRDGKLLTGADLDPESLVKMPDGTYWLGDEFGPFLLHFDATGTLLDEPVPHPVLRSPQNPMKDKPNLPGSRGFEALTRNADGTRLYVTTEASINTEPDERLLVVYEFDPAAKQYTDRSFKYRKDGDATKNEIVVGDMTHVAGGVYLVLERDSEQGPAAQTKRVYRVDLNRVDGDDVLVKELLIDLLNIPDPTDLAGPLPRRSPGTFDFPIQSVESICLTSPTTLLVAADTNYPSGNGRRPGKPDDTEIIRIEFAEPIATTPAVSGNN